MESGDMKRSYLRFAIPAALAIGILLPSLFTPAARAQNPDEMLPAASAAKAKGILEQAIAALGGPAYLHAGNSDCSGRYAQFQHSGDVGGYLVFRDYHEFPDKNRMEYGPKGNIVDLYAGDQGWTLDRGGVSEIPAKDVADYQEQVKTDLNNILRFRMGDSTLVFRYGGTEVVDLKVSDWAEITDRDGHTIRIAVDQATHLPVRAVVIDRDSDGALQRRATAYTTYHEIQGIQTPYQVSRFLNDRQVYQVFYDSCQYNEALPENLFTRNSLDDAFAAVRKKKK